MLRSPVSGRGRADKARTRRPRGQILVVFAASMVLLVGLLALVIDVTWYWTNSLKVQRAADAAALAGAVWLPDRTDKAYAAAFAAATRNGYTTGGGVTVTAVQDPAKNIQLDTRISAPVPTFFMNLFGIRTITATRTASAEYVLPVPMGSPLNYFGAFGTIRGAGPIPTDSGWRFPTRTMNVSAYGSVPDGWSNPPGAFVDESPDPALNTSVSGVTAYQAFTTFRAEDRPNNADFGMSTTATLDFTRGGIEVVVKASGGAGCRLQVEVTGNANNGASATWYGLATGNSANGNPATLTTTPTEYEFGGDAGTAANDASDWWRTSGSWTRADFTDAEFGLRIKSVAVGGAVPASCSSETTVVDYVKVRVNYRETAPPIKGPNGENLNKQGVWAGILSQGADKVNGDAYSPQKLSGGGGSNAEYLQTSYDYAVEFQPGTDRGSLHIFDPVFCDGTFDTGMGDEWYDDGNTSGVSTFFDLWDTNNTLYDLSDDVWVAGNSGPSGSSNPQFNLFRNSRCTDPDLGGESASNGRTDGRRGATNDKTQGRYWHNRWWRLTNNIPGPVDSVPRIYRLRVASTVPGAASEQANVNALNNFSMFASVRGHDCPSSPVDPKCPRIYGLGVMEAFAPLESASTADLYLSQISSAYAGKTIRISLWDPGDTNMTATLSFRMPTTTGYVNAPFTYTATKVAGSGSCYSTSGSGSSLVTYSGGSRYNGCWVVFNVPIPANYAAPTPPGEPGPGWWKIRYVMGGSSGDTASDLTTWKTQIVGNPVHLVIP